jgi:hypothetical protein
MQSLKSAAILGVGLALAGTAVTTRAGTQNPDPPSRRCGVETLHGSYGLQWTGVRPIGPGAPPPVETFTGVAIRTFDGAGNFTQISNVKGAVTGIQPPDIESVGTYEVNEDCSGTAASPFVPGGPLVTARFVTVADGDEVLQSVMTPDALFNAGVMRKIRRR